MSTCQCTISISQHKASSNNFLLIMTTSLCSNLYRKGKVAVQCTGRLFFKRTHCYPWSSKQTFRSSQTCHHKHSYQTDLKQSHCKTSMSLQSHKQGLSTLSINTHGTTCPYRTLCNHMTTNSSPRDT